MPRAKQVLAQRVFHVARVPIGQEAQQTYSAVDHAGQNNKQNACKATRRLGLCDSPLQRCCHMSGMQRQTGGRGGCGIFSSRSCTAEGGCATRASCSKLLTGAGRLCCYG